MLRLGVRVMVGVKVGIDAMPSPGPTRPVMCPDRDAIEGEGAAEGTRKGMAWAVIMVEVLIDCRGEVPGLMR